MPKKRKCDNEDNQATHILINGAEEQTLCEVCLESELFDLVTNNDFVSFCQSPEKRDGLAVISVT